MVDKFTLKCPNLGQLWKVLVDCDGSGLGADWHLEQIAVFDTRLDTSTTFAYDEWINAKNGWQQELYADNSPEMHKAMAVYHVTVWTADCKFAGTDAGVFIEVNGTLDGKAMSTKRQVLASSKNDFERASEGHYSFRCAGEGRGAGTEGRRCVQLLSPA